MYKKILLPTDGSEHANKAVEHVIWAANSSGAEIIVLNVAETSKLPEMRVQDLEEQMRVMLIEKAKAAFDDVSKSLNKLNSGIKLSFVSKEGSPANEILKTIEEDGIDLVVMGTSGKNDFDVLLLGSVAEKVVRNAKCTVTIVH